MMWAVGLYLALLLLRAGLALSYARRQGEAIGEPMADGTLTLAQAILSGDPLLEARLEGNVVALSRQRFIWLIDDDDTEAKRIAALLVERHPLANIRVKTCPACPEGSNPKLWKLRLTRGMVETPYFGVLDDDTTLPAQTAAALVRAAQSGAVATGLPCYDDSGDWPSALLAQFVNNNSAFTYLGTARLLEPFTLSGMGYVMRTEMLEQLDYFAPIMNELTDDLALATLVLTRGGSIYQSTEQLRVQTGVKNLEHYGQLMHRWYVFTLLLMRRQSVQVQALIFVLHGLPPMLLLGIFLWLFNPMSVLALVVVRACVLVGIQRRFFGGGLHRVMASLLSELVQPFHLLHAFMVRTIRWRTRVYEVRDTDDFSSV